eukprot:TRINITY_DN8802_c0_g1_i1.p1 TRINITY_DN8802_c0_g1~~TRINITY_DN8802_c0_g1_i1.p1  ORF type:complete len:372 (+),score=143.44 TRINITY_DN8802_c0_g1_i1:328-1443(+)
MLSTGARRHCCTCTCVPGDQHNQSDAAPMKAVDGDASVLHGCVLRPDDMLCEEHAYEPVEDAHPTQEVHLQPTDLLDLLQPGSAQAAERSIAEFVPCVCAASEIDSFYAEGCEQAPAQQVHQQEVLDHDLEEYMRERAGDQALAEVLQAPAPKGQEQPNWWEESSDKWAAQEEIPVAHPGREGMLQPRASRQAAAKKERKRLDKEARRQARKKKQEQEQEGSEWPADCNPFAAPEQHQQAAAPEPAQAPAPAPPPVAAEASAKAEAAQEALVQEEPAVPEDWEWIVAELQKMGFPSQCAVCCVLRCNGSLDTALESALAECWQEGWGALLLELAEMGFEDEALNRRAVAEHQGNLKSIVAALITAERAACQ